LREVRPFAVALLVGIQFLSICGPGAVADAPRGQTNWWSFQPLVRPAVPQIRNPPSTARNPIDAFILARLTDRRLSPSPEADGRTLIRRLYFDLIGLPPTPEEVEAFGREVSRSPSLASSPGSRRSRHAGKREQGNTAYEQLVDKLLASPHYGERWARHWLDVVHYGDSHGYDKDKPRPNAWPYRDYVIRAFNEDKPYARFVQEQIAGDVLFPGTRDGIEALGFIAAGPWDFIGHAELPETKIDGQIARHLDRDDMVANTMTTFTSLTAACAQCHDHKFDPISQREYYGLQAVFAALDRADKKYFADPRQTQRFAELERQQSALREQKRVLEAALARAAGGELADIDSRIETAGRRSRGNRAAEFGYHSAIEKTPDAIKWVQVDLGRSVLADRIVLVPCYDDFNNIGAGFGFPVRFKVELSEDAAFPPGKVTTLHASDADEPNPGLKERSFAAFGAVSRFVRITATKLAPRKDDFIFALAELRVLDSNGANLTKGATVTALDSIEAPPRWRKSNLVDEITPENDSADELAKLRADRAALLHRVASESQRSELSRLDATLARIANELKSFPPPDVVYAGTVHHGSGNFTGTGANGGKPRPIHVLHRGDVRQPQEEVSPGALRAIGHVGSPFPLPPGHTEGERRAALAKWLTDPQNPLTWRSIVNRVWQYHFGRGLVDTPNDFGRMGALPTHPELLDWLACEFRDSGGSFKHLHKLIVSSATYRQASSVISHQSSVISPALSRKLITDYFSHTATVDPDNHFLWRQNRRKLDAESLRDSVLFVSGKLDTRMGGPAFEDFVIEKPEHSPHYQYHLHDPDDPKSHRRSIYRFIVRSQLQPFMNALDCADPSIQVGKRNESLSALQALTLLNNGLMVTMSKHFAAKLDAQGGSLDDKMNRAFIEALARKPTKEEQSAMTDYAREHGLANACRLLFNLNEFTFVD